MKNRLATCAVALAALVCAGSLRAHHSASMFDLSKPIWVKGTVVSYVPANPHVMIALDEKKEDGQVRRWTVEGPILLRLNRMSLPADFLKAGDVIEVCGFPFKEEVLARNPSSGAGGRLPAVHGQVLVMLDGHMQPWGPYGKLENCVRPNDRTQPWLDFVNTYPMAREYWCNSPHNVGTASIASKTFVDEITRLMATPCE